MPTLSSLYNLVIADFKERVRQYGFFVAVGLSMLLSYQLLSGTFYIVLGDYRGLYNAAWMGLLMGVTLAIFMWLFGFYLVRGSVERDRETGVGQILATTPMWKVSYVIGKFISNLMVLLALIGVLFVAALAMLLSQGEDKTLDLWVLISPFLLITLPVAALAAATAVFFETVPFLRRSFGNFAFFILSISTIQGAVMSLLGFDLIQTQVIARLQDLDPTYDGSFALNAQAIHSEARTFLWDGFYWTPEVIIGRLVWIVAALAIMLMAALPFDRFETAKRRAARRGWFARIGESIGGMFRSTVPHHAMWPVHGTLTPLPDTATHRGRFMTILSGELKLLLKGMPWWWYVSAAGLVLASLISPLEDLRRFVLPLAWLWPMPIWSQMGVREGRHHTQEIIFSTPWPVLRLLPATWLAGVVIAMSAGSGAGVRFVVAGDIPGLAAWGTAAMFLPAMALALGVWGARSRAFEIVLLTMWYMGPMNRVPALDYTSATPESWLMGMPAFYGALAIALLIAALIGRARQLQR